MTAYALAPVALPALLVAVGVVAVVMLRPEYGIALALALAPLTNLELGAGEGTLKPLQLLLPALSLGLVVYGFLVARGRRAFGASRGLALAVLVFVFAAVFSSVQALEPEQSTKKIVILVTAAALFVAVLQFCRERSRLAVVVAGAVAGLLVAGAQGVAQNYLGIRGVAGFVVDDVLVNRVQGSFGHPNQYGGYLAFLIPLALAVVLTRRFGAAARVSASAAVALGVVGLALSFARGAIIGLVLGSLIWLAVLRPRAALAVTAVVALASALLIPGTLRERFDPEATRGDVPLRVDIWGSALEIASRHPVLGVGVNNFAAGYERLPSTLTFASQRHFLEAEEFLVPPHAQNLYLNVLAEGGVVGVAALLLLLGMAVVVLYRAARARDPRTVAVGLGGGAGVIAVVVHSFAEVTLLTELALPFFALAAVAAVYVALEQRDARPDAATAAAAPAALTDASS